MDKHRRNSFPGNRISIVISASTDTKIKLKLASDIIQHTKSDSDLPTMSYSRVVNNALTMAFQKGIDKKLISNAKQLGN